MPVASESTSETTPARTEETRHLYRSNEQRVIAGVCGGLGEYFAVDPVWFRLGFVVLALAGGSGVLIYLLMWLILQPRPDGYAPPANPGRKQVPGAAILGLVFMVVGTVALVNTIAPWMGQYVWPVILVAGGLALLLGGLNHDSH
ncbi:MAG TPA: PspC domain-containing protein [Acidimicrobiia bacterium]|nr:PspC domain-containing protein [Acidimicrobiia bacterium]